MPNVLSQFPDLAALLSQRETLAGGIAGVTNLLPADTAQLLGNLPAGLANLQGALPANPAELTSTLQSTLGALSHALPADTSAVLQEAVQALHGAIELLNRSQIQELLDAEGGFETIRDLIFDKVGDLFGAVETILSDMAAKILPVEALELLSVFAQAIAQFEAALPSDPTQLATFLARFFVNVPYDLLAQPLTLHQNLLHTIDGIVDTGAFETARGSVTQGLRAVQPLLGNLDLENAASFQAAIDALNGVQAQMEMVKSAVTDLANTFQSGLGGLSLSDFTNQLHTLLDGVQDIRMARADDFTTVVVAQVQELNQRLNGADAADIAATIRHVADTMQAYLDGFDIVQLRHDFLQFFRDLGGRIAALDLEALRQAITSLFTDLEAQLDAFSLSALQQAIRDLFAQLTQIIDGLDVSVIQTTIEQLVQQLQDGLDQLPVVDFQNLLRSILEQVQALIDEASAGVAAVLPQIQSVVAGLGEIDFAPVIEPVIAQMQDTKAQLQQIDVAALPDSLRPVLATAVGFLKDIDFPGTISAPLMEQYDNLVPAALLGTLRGQIHTLLAKVEGVNPEAIFAPLEALIAQMDQALRSASPAALLDPLLAEFDTLTQSILTRMAPQALLAPIQGVYDDLVATLHAYAPGQLLAPVTENVQQVRAYVDAIDPSSLFQEAENLLTTWFANARSSLQQVTNTLQQALSNTPEIGDLVRHIEATLDLMGPQLFVDPLAAVDAMTDALAAFKPGDLLAPLHGFFTRLMSMLDAVADEVLVDSVKAVQRQLVDALDDLSPVGLLAAVPARLHTRLQAIDVTHNPQLLADMQQAYVGVVNAFDTLVPDAIPAALQPRYDEIWALLHGLDPLSAFAAHHTTFAQVRAQIAQVVQTFDVEPVATAFGNIAGRVESLLPDFLRQEHLTAADLKTALQALGLAPVIDAVNTAYETFRDQALALMPVLRPEIVHLLTVIKERLLVITPTVFAEALSEITEPLKNQLAALSPEPIIQTLDDIYRRLIGKLEPLNPTTIAAGLDEVFTSLEAKLEQCKTQGLLLLKTRLETLWADLLSRLEPLSPEALKASLMQMFEQLLAAAQSDIDAIFTALEGAFEQLRTKLEAALRQTAREFQALVTAIPV